MPTDVKSSIFQIYPKQSFAFNKKLERLKAEMSAVRTSERPVLIV